MNSVFNYIILGAVFALVVVGSAMWIEVNAVTSTTQCHMFQPTDSSHIRMNTCTGEAHVIVRGPNGFEWQRVNDRP